MRALGPTQFLDVHSLKSEQEGGGGVEDLQPDRTRPGQKNHPIGHPIRNPNVQYVNPHIQFICGVDFGLCGRAWTHPPCQTDIVWPCTYPIRNPTLACPDTLPPLQSPTSPLPSPTLHHGQLRQRLRVRSRRKLGWARGGGFKPRVLRRGARPSLEDKRGYLSCAPVACLDDCSRWSKRSAPSLDPVCASPKAQRSGPTTGISAAGCWKCMVAPMCSFGN